MALGCMHNARSKLSSRKHSGPHRRIIRAQYAPMVSLLQKAELGREQTCTPYWRVCNALARESEVVWTNIDSVDKAPFVAAAEAARSTTLHQRWNRHGAYLKLTGKLRLACNKIWIFFVVSICKFAAQFGNSSHKPHNPHLLPKPLYRICLQIQAKVFNQRLPQL